MTALSDPVAATATTARDDARGLSTGEAERRRAAYGPNALDPPPRRTALMRFVDQFRSLLILILLGAAVIAGFLGDVKDVVVIGAVVIGNAVLGFVQEGRAEKSLAALKGMLVARTRVRRDGQVVEIDAEELVPGDIVLLESGDRVPADGHWLVAYDLDVDESAFTGESMPVHKDVGDPVDGAPLAERPWAAFMNTTVVRGRGELLVTDTGMRTEIGRLAGMLNAAPTEPTPLQRQIHDLGKRLSLVAGAAVVLVIGLGLLRDTPIGEKLLDAIALAVAAIPEGLPAVLTVTLAVGTYALARQQAIVKRLASVETLGCTTVICSDKTGTLTKNEMTVREVWPAPVHQLLHTMVLCNDAHVDEERRIGDPTETALVAYAGERGVPSPPLRAALPRIAEIPFDSGSKFMATFHDTESAVEVRVKGAFDVLLARCDVDTAMLHRAHAAHDGMASKGMRVLACASRTITREMYERTPRAELVRELELDGLVGIADPPRPEARDAIALCRRAGVRVKMITGDHAATATAIAAELGIQGETITGAEIDRLTPDELASRVQGIGVFARVAPEHKVAIVRALKEHDEIVAMTGDGVNDAPALKHADIGIAMGITGTAVTREAATMVLADDNFATIVKAVEGGRTIYENILKFVSFQLSTNLGAILTIVTAAVLAWPADGAAFFTPLAILWVNLIMDGPPAMALGVDPTAPGAMERAPRRPDAKILDGRRFLQLLGYGAFMAVGTLAVYRFAIGSGSPSPLDEARAATMALATFVFFQMANVHNVRFPSRSAFGRHSLRNGKLWIALGVVAVLQVLAVEWDALQRVLTGRDVAAQLSMTDWLLVVATAASVLVVDEVRKLVQRRVPVPRRSR